MALPGLERELLRLLSQGLTLRQAAAQLHYSYGYLKRVQAEASHHLGAETVGQALYLSGRWRLF